MPWIFAYRRVTFWQQRQKVTKKRRLPTTAPSYRKRRSAIRGYPALLACVGVQRQAIPGLTLDASASCLARRQTAAGQSPTQAAMLGAVTGGTSKAQQQPKHSNIKSQASLPLVPSPLGGSLRKYPHRDIEAEISDGTSQQRTTGFG